MYEFVTKNVNITGGDVNLNNSSINAEKSIAALFYLLFRHGIFYAVYIAQNKAAKERKIHLADSYFKHSGFINCGKNAYFVKNVSPTT